MFYSPQRTYCFSLTDRGLHLQKMLIMISGNFLLNANAVLRAAERLCCPRLFSVQKGVINSPDLELLKVSYCDRSTSVMRRVASTICFK